ncbi:MAG: hypothetical protein SNI46_04230 [Rikenellaceae bacterium]
MGQLLKSMFLAALLCGATLDSSASVTPVKMSKEVKRQLKGRQILYVERNQYAEDHHNTANLFMAGEINTKSFDPGSALSIYDVDSKKITTLLESESGVIRDPEMSFDGEKIIFSMRQNIDDSYHIYEICVDGSNLKQLTFAHNVADIDPLYLPDGGIIFGSTRDQKYCMCNRHIMSNLHRMNSDGSNITQIGVSTLFEGHSALLNDGRILYDRWEYVDRNFGNAQGLWSCNPDGTKHSIYYGNNTPSPGGVIDGRAIPNSNKVVCIFGSCHDIAWGALAIIDRQRGVDGVEAVIDIWPKSSCDLMLPTNSKAGLDSFKAIEYCYEDPFPIDEHNFLVSRTVKSKESFRQKRNPDRRMALFFISTNGIEEMLLKGSRSIVDAQFVEPRFKPNTIPSMRNYEDEFGTFYVQNVYEGTYAKGIEHGTAKYLRVVETPAKRSWAGIYAWGGEGVQHPGVNWHSFEVKRLWGDVLIEDDGSASFEAPVGVHLYFQLLDKDKKMIQSMRSGVSLMPGEVNGCIGCHEDRLSIPPSTSSMALKKSPQSFSDWGVSQSPKNYSYLEEVQPILDRRCVECHDFDINNRKKLVLAGDKNPYFNASYINLYVTKAVSLVGAGPAQIQEPYSWGSHTSKLSSIIENKHSHHTDVELTEQERQTLYTWMDLNGVYYPTYETSFGDNIAGRCPLTIAETNELSALTGLNFRKALSNWWRSATAQVSFDRPELSPCLDAIRSDSVKYARALELLMLGQERLKATPRGDIESQLVIYDTQKQQLKRYTERLADDIQNSCNIDINERRYDKR